MGYFDSNRFTNKLCKGIYHRCFTAYQEPLFLIHFIGAQNNILFSIETDQQDFITEKNWNQNYKKTKTKN